MINKDTLRPHDIVTTAGDVFTEEEHKQLAQLVYKRWGRSPGDAACAWRRLFQNSCTEADFFRLVTEG